MRPKQYRAFGCLAVVSALGCLSAHATTPSTVPAAATEPAQPAEGGTGTTPDAATELPAMTVSAHQFGIPVSRTGVSVTTIDPAVLRREGIYTLTDSLTYTPGVYVGHDGGERGSIAAIRLRGLNSSVYTMNVVDGIRLSDSNISPASYFGAQTTFGLDSIEVLRGPQGAMYGGDAIGGVVRQSTPRGTGEPSLSLFGEGGSYGSGVGVLSAQGQTGKNSYYYSGGYETIQNDNRNWPAGGGNDFQHWFQNASFYHQINADNSIGMTVRYSNNMFESPTRLTNPDWSPAGTGYKHDKAQTWLTTLQGAHRINDFWTSEWNAGMFRQDTQSTSPSALYSAFDSRAYKYQANWYNMLTWTEKTRSIVGATYDYTKYDSSSSTLSRNTNNTYAVFGEQLYQPWKWLDLSAAVRAERQTAWGNKVTWRGGFSIQAVPERTRVFGTIGTGYRTPSFNDLYSDFGYYRGNPDLRPMDTLGGDLGIEQKILKDHVFTVTGFATELRDAIVYDGNSFPNTMINAGTANVAGVETSIAGKFRDAWNTSYIVQYTYAHTRGMNGQPLPGSARNVWSGMVKTNPTDKWSFGGGFAAATGREAIYTAAELGGYFTARLFTRYQVTENIAVHARVENLFDRKYDLQYDWDGALPARGLGVYGGVTVEF